MRPWSAAALLWPPQVSLRPGRVGDGLEEGPPRAGGWARPREQERLPAGALPRPRRPGGGEPGAAPTPPGARPVREPASLMARAARVRRGCGAPFPTLRQPRLEAAARAGGGAVFPRRGPARPRAASAALGAGRGSGRLESPALCAPRGHVIAARLRPGLGVSAAEAKGRSECWVRSCPCFPAKAFQKGFSCKAHLTPRGAVVKKKGARWTPGDPCPDLGSDVLIDTTSWVTHFDTLCKWPRPTVSKSLL